MVLEEKWDHEDKWIMPYQVRKIRLPDVDPSIAPQFQAGLAMHQQMMANMDPEIMREALNHLQNNKGDMFRRMLSAMGREDDIDPAFMYALNNTDFFAKYVSTNSSVMAQADVTCYDRPWEGQISKVEGKKRMDEWNNQVDRYIATAGDPRPRFDIELQAKIGIHGGPLYRRCEAEDCDRVEVRDVEKLKCCGSCKMVCFSGHR